MAADKKVILMVSFGTSYNDNRAKTIGAIEEDIASRYPEWEVRRAFTSKMIIKKLAKRDGEIIDYISEALERLIDDGIKTVLVQPTHIMNGTEYDFVMEFVNKYKDSFDNLSVGKPLLTTIEDYDLVVEALAESLNEEAKEIAGKDAAVVLMGHGTEHFANSTYSQLHLMVQLSGLSNMYVTTVEGFPTFDDTLELMRDKGIKDVVLFPFMLVAGDHANNDMAGDDDDTLKSVLEAEGYKVHPVVKGLGEYPQFRELFANHVEEAMQNFTI